MLHNRYRFPFHKLRSIPCAIAQVETLVVPIVVGNGITPAPASVALLLALGQVRDGRD